jgi:hypothetical protein
MQKMGTILDLNDLYFNNAYFYEDKNNMEMNSKGKPNFREDNLSLTAEGGKIFFQYLKSFNLFREPEILIISPNIHFYYDENDLKDIKTFLLLKKLNLIKDLDTLLHTISLILPTDVNFVGCFSDGKAFKWNGFLTNLSSRFYNILDSKTDNIMDKKDVSELLEKHGFKIIDMSEINGLTLFYSKTVNQPK